MTFTTRSDDQPRKSDTSRSGAGGKQSGAKRRRNRRRRQAQAQHSRSETTTQTPKKRPNERAVAAVEKRNQATTQSKPAGVTVGKTTTEGTDQKTSGRRRNNHRRSRSRATARKKNTQRNGNRNVNRSSYAEAKMPTRTETSVNQYSYDRGRRSWRGTARGRRAGTAAPGCGHRHPVPPGLR